MPLTIMRYVLTWPRFLGWLFPLLAVVCYFARDLRLAEDGVLVATWRDWWASRWKWSTTLGAGMCMHPSHGARTHAHERVHVRQSEVLALGGLLVAVVVSIAAERGWWLLILWPAVPLLVRAGSFAGALLRGGHIYRDAEHERSAYAQTDHREGKVGSWLEEHESRPRTW